MAIVVEDGSIVAGANSYGTRAGLIAYAAARGKTIPDTAAADVYLINAMDWLESQALPGIKYTDLQTTQWPRAGAYVYGYSIAVDVIPVLLIEVQYEAAIADFEGYGQLAVRQRVKQSVTVGPISATYASNGPSNPVPTALYNKLKLITGNSGGGGFGFRVAPA